MIKKLAIVIRKVCTSIFILYGLNFILNSINIVIPINVISILVVTLLGFPGLFSLILMFLIIK
ncbi:MAG TPA: pro-sigmaK processing inhibitor BofA family protein [Bacilli bacterium]|nr:pro-sigmaK processing inhibitor BofA family protein [Bacilli bacterium]